MKFSRALKEIVWRLVTEERVSYHSIRRDFGLDDDALEDLRYFLVQKKALAADQDGKFHVTAVNINPALKRSAHDGTRQRMLRWFRLGIKQRS